MALLLCFLVLRAPIFYFCDVGHPVRANTAQTERKGCKRERGLTKHGMEKVHTRDTSNQTSCTRWRPAIFCDYQCTHLRQYVVQPSFVFVLSRQQRCLEKHRAAHTATRRSWWHASCCREKGSLLLCDVIPLLTAAALRLYTAACELCMRASTPSTQEKGRHAGTLPAVFWISPLCRVCAPSRADPYVNTAG